MSLLRRPMPRMHEAHRPFGAGLPVWQLAAQAVIVLFVFVAFDTLPVTINPKPGFVFNVMMLGTVVLLAPRGLLRHIYLSATVVMFFAWWIASVAWTAMPGEWANTTITQVSWTALLLVVASVLPKEKIVATLLGAVYAMVLWTLVWTALHPGDSTVLIQPGTGELVNVGWRGAFGHKNVMASFMILGMLVVLAYEPRVGRRRLAVVTMVGLVLLSRSGTGAGGMIATLAAFGFARRVSREQGRKVGATVVIAGLSALLAIVGVLTFLPAIVSLYGKDLTFTGRTQIWSASLHAIGQRPWTGYGWGGVWLDPTREPTFGIVRRLGFIVFHAHNGPIELMLELGVIGLALYLAMFLATVRDGWRLLHRDPEVAHIVLGYCTLVFITSISEVLVVGPWLSLLVMLRTLAMRSLREPAHQPVLAPRRDRGRASIAGRGVALAAPGR